MNIFKKWFKLGSRSSDILFEDILAKYSIVDVVPGTADHGPFVIVTDKSEATFTDSQGISFEPDPIIDDPFNYNNFGGSNTKRNTARRPSNPVVPESTRAAIQLKETPSLGEVSSTNPTSEFTGRGEYNSAVTGENGFDKFNRARLGDGVIAGVILAVKTPVYAANWRVDPSTDLPEDIEAATFTQRCLMEFQSISWTQILIDAMLCADYGFMIFEKVWEIRKINGVRRAVLKKLSPRHPADVIDINYDKHGGPESVEFAIVDDDGMTTEKTIPIEKLLIISLNQEVGTVTGRSIIRPMYQHYFYKTQLYKIDAIQKERHGIGIPVIKLPNGYKEQDKLDANVLGRNLRTNERAHVVLPPNWEIIFAKLEGNPVNAMESIEYHDSAIRESVLAGFLGSENMTSDQDLGLFLKSTRFIANSICDAFNRYLIPDIIKYNFDNVSMPKLQVRQIGEQADNRTMSFTLRNMVGAGLIRPDDRLEAYLRELFDLPPVDLETLRVVKSPQAGQQPATTPNATPGTNTQLEPTSGKTDGTAGSTGLPRQTALPSIDVGGANVGNARGGGQ